MTDKSGANPAAPQAVNTGRGILIKIRQVNYLSNVVEQTRQHFALKQHLLRASLYRNRLAAGSPHGANLPTSPKLRRLLSAATVLHASTSTKFRKLTMPYLVF
jgi:hypothetical protein